MESVEKSESTYHKLDDENDGRNDIKLKSPSQRAQEQAALDSKIEHEKNPGWMAWKVVTTGLFVIMFPLLVLDTFLSDTFGTRQWVLFWYVSDTSAANRSVFWKEIRSGKGRWVLGLLLWFTILGLHFIVVNVIWPAYGGGTYGVVWTIRGLFGCEAAALLVVLGVVAFRETDYHQIDYPSTAIRFKHWQNWVALISIVYDLFALSSFVVRPEVPYPEDSGLTDVFGASWQTLGINQEALAFWLSFALACVWIGVALFAFFMVEIYKNESRGLDNKYMITLIPILSQSLFLYISVNMLSALKGYDTDTTPNFIESYPEWKQRGITICGLFTIIWYGTTAMLYAGVLNARSDNIFVDERLDVKFKQSYIMMESLLKQFLAASNIFTQGEKGLLIPSLIVSLLICTTILGLILWSQPCCIKTVNVIKAVVFGFLSWASLCSLIAVGGYSDANTTVSNTWVPFILLIVGYILIGAGAIFYYYRTYKTWSVTPGRLYYWGFDPVHQHEEAWWQKKTPVRVTQPKMRWGQAACGTLPYTVAVTREGMVFSTGINDRGQLGHDDDTYRYMFTLEYNLWTDHVLVKNVSCGSEHVVVVSEQGTVWTCGRGSEGQLGHGDLFDQTLPQRITSINNVQVLQAACGDYFTALVSTDGRFFTFGDASHGKLGHGLSGSASSVTLEDKRICETLPKEVGALKEQSIIYVACGSEHTLVLARGGRIYGFGDNQFGQLGVGDRDPRDVPTIVNGLWLTQPHKLACGSQHSLILTEDGRVYSFGQGSDGQLGHGDKTESAKSEVLVPRVIEGLRDRKILVIAAGVAHSAVACDDGHLYVFGNGGDYRLGNDTDKNIYTPFEVRIAGYVEGDLITQIALGRTHSTIVTARGRMYTWGTSNSFCGLGYPTDDAVLNLPTKRSVELEKDETLVQLDLGADHLGLVTSTGRILTVGNYDKGQLGLGERFKASSEKNAEIIDLEQQSDYVTLTEKAPFLGDGVGESYGSVDGEGINIDTKSNPLKRIDAAKPVPGLSNFVVTRVSCGWWYTAAITDSGACYTWGSGPVGQLGHGTELTRCNSPKLLEAFNEIKIADICCANVHTIAASVDGQVYTWGSDGAAVDEFYGFSLPPCRGLLGGAKPIVGSDDINPFDNKDGKDIKGSFVPLLVEDTLKGKKVVNVSCGFAHSTAVTETGELYTWGYGWFAPLGHGDTKNQPTPRLVQSLVDHEVKIVKAVCGLIHTVSLSADGKVYTHGMGGHAQLGHGDTKRQLIPKLVEKLVPEGKILEIAAGSYQTAVLVENGSVFICGSYLLGALGVGDVHRPLLKPKIVGGLLGRSNTRVSCGNHFVACV